MAYNQPADQQERKEILDSDRKVRSTYRDFAESDDLGGRFSKLHSTSVTGSPVSYPQQPKSSPWSSDPVPSGDAVDKLGFAIDEQEVIGSLLEQEAARRILEDRALKAALDASERADRGRAPSKSEQFRRRTVPLADGGSPTSPRIRRRL
jgi:hypothetical protein